MSLKRKKDDYSEIKAILKDVSKKHQEIAQKQEKTEYSINQLKERQAEFSKEAFKRQEKIDLLLTKQAKEADHRIKKLDELFSSQWGKLIESLVEGDLIRLLNERGLVLNRTSENVKGRWKNQIREVDILALNGKEMVAVEVKTTLKATHVKHFLKTLKDFTNYYPEYSGKKIYGALAYLKAHESSRKFAESQGLFVIRATGNSASIMNAPLFKPKAF